MSRTRWVLGLFVLFAIGIGGWFVALPEAGRGSSVSRGPEGWLAARLYLEGRGGEVELLDRSPEVAEPQGVVVEVFPWRQTDPARVRGLRRHLARGGSLVLAYSGGFGLSEDAAFEALGLPLRAIRDDLPLAPLAWRAEARRDWTLAAEGGAGGDLSVPAPSWVPRAPDDAVVTYRAPDGQPLVFDYRHGGGRVVALPAAALANASLAEASNADLLEGLYRALGPVWAFDENAHGLMAAEDAGAGGTTRVFDLLLIHLAVLYLLVILARVRRFGPAWTEQPAATGSVSAYLVGLGRLHDRLGHHAAAARQLLARWQALHPRLSPPEEVSADAVRDAQGLVALSTTLAEQRSSLAAGVRGKAASGILPADVPALPSGDRGGFE